MGWRISKIERRKMRALQSVRKRLLDKCNWECPQCERYLFLSPSMKDRSWKATLDHIIPVSKGGARFDIRNLQVLCSKCNRKKGDSLLTPEHEGRRFPPTCLTRSSRSSNPQPSSSGVSSWGRSSLPP